MRSGLMISVAAGLLALAPRAEACFCAWPSTPEQFRDARLVFRGRAERTRPVRVPTRDEPGEGGVVTAEEVTFKGLERFKGPAADSYKVLNGPCLVLVPGEDCVNSCAAGVEIGSEYLVFAFPDAAEGADTETPSISRCSIFSSRSADFKRLIPEVRLLAPKP